MAEFIKPYNDDPFVGNLSTPVSTSSFSKGLLGNLPAYRRGLSPLLRGLEIGMAHGYFLIGPFDKLGPLRGTDVALLAGFLSSVGLIIILTTCLSMYGNVSFTRSDSKDPLQTAEGWGQFTAGFLVGAVGGSGFAYLLLANIPVLQTAGLSLFS
ncbi:photosystem I subunit XI (chloroplast) [Porphyra umbilicalis]|uniref:Photosystem I reaction center subunit XI n=2 Tax=Porphyra TaxID=2784 RepID=PSAL_PORPU|nr:photosystem I subunit XI [Porphyra purpurea]YP_009413235.1 photosystem I subunit XI [Porphyra umbilicalis]YP_010338294.1 photosystem I subunit XI [Bangia atropurpurea]P51222.1 RecName: Full=Photosystem I reaction center subunit XI; AltName: Full=PSI subunit V; AltName: Full=PSI-L [Porphyra purpurea]BED43070.1 photosystem I subunit XI [Pyropia sp. Myanmar_A]BED43267.1 photosystem I subunit XI [Pyropia sp. Myanmar_B]BED43464.1 photosystem I subunit XI [Pyropia sp. Myanmar_C]AAC08108.1 Photo|eukprot:ASN78696.1 photosystem I subunit XI (chloroplast) [Porphyra umbilicalis]